MEEELLSPKVKLNKSDDSSQIDQDEPLINVDSKKDLEAESVAEFNNSIEEEKAFDKAQVLLAQNILGDRFKVHSLIGQGGMGSIYKVDDKKTDRVAALKLLKPELCKDKSTRKRFIKEAEYLSALDNENVVSIYDFGVATNGTPYLVMQYLHGGSLDELLIDKKALEPDETIKIALEICKALEFAHSKDLVHRDIKPSNVLLSTLAEDESAQALLTDFGIAKFLKESESKTTQLTQTGDFFGTPAYMSPEQCEGSDIDHRSDIYSLGCLLYKMVTGVEPYAGLTPVQVAVKHISSEPERFAKDYPDGHRLVSLQEVIFKCMRKDRLERYQSIKEIVEDLQLIESGKSVGYAEDEDKTNKKGVVAWTGELAKAAVFVAISSLAIMLYIATLSSLFDKYTDGSSVGSNTSIVMFCLTGLFFYTKPTYHFLKEFKKRRTLGDWCDKLTTLGIFATYLICMLPTIPGLTHPFTDIAVILVATTILSTIGILSFNVTRIISNWIFRPIIAIVDYLIRLFNKSHKATKHRSIPIRLTSALNRVILGLAVILTSYQIFFPQEASNIFSKISELDQKYNGTFAEPLMRLAVKTSNNDPEKTTQLAELIAQRGDIDKALTILSASLAKNPTSYYLAAGKARIEQSAHLNRKAVSDITKALVVHSKDSELFKLRGQAYLELGDYQSAESDFKKAIDNATDANYNYDYSISDLYSRLGLVKYQQQNYKQAISDYSIAIEKGRNLNRNYMRRALAFNAIGEKLQSNRNLEEAINASSYEDTAEANLIRAYAANQLGQKDNFDNYLKKAQEKGLDKDGITKAIFGNLPMVKLEW